MKNKDMNFLIKNSDLDQKPKSSIMKRNYEAYQVQNSQNLCNQNITRNENLSSQNDNFKSNSNHHKTGSVYTDKS